jgi:putative flippase GtrA
MQTFPPNTQQKEAETFLVTLLDSRKLRYLLVGGMNTVVGYGLGVGLYLLLSPAFHILLIGLVANVLAISFSFTTHKLLVFRTQDHWLSEYLRSYLVYGGMGLMGTLLLWALVDGIHLPIWIAQGVAIGLTVVFSYLGHARFTFRAGVVSRHRSS